MPAIHPRSNSSLVPNTNSITQTVTTTSQSTTSTLHSSEEQTSHHSSIEQPPETQPRMTHALGLEHSSVDDDSSSRSFATSIPSDLFYDKNSDNEEPNAPFQIHRKLLRRRHVRKEQIQRRKQQEKAKLAEKKERERRKRSRVEQTHEKRDEAADSTIELALLKKSNKASPQQMNVSIHHHGVPISPHCDSPTFIRVPQFSPLRPKKRRNIRFQY